MDFYYGASTKPIKAKTSESDLRVFALHYHDGRRVLKTDNRSQAVRAADMEKIRLTTVGGHYISGGKSGSGQGGCADLGRGAVWRLGQAESSGGAIAG